MAPTDIADRALEPLAPTFQRNSSWFRSLPVFLSLKLCMLHFGNNGSAKQNGKEEKRRVNVAVAFSMFQACSAKEDIVQKQ